MGVGRFIGRFRLVGSFRFVVAGTVGRFRLVVLTGEGRVEEEGEDDLKSEEQSRQKLRK